MPQDLFPPATATDGLTDAELRATAVPVSISGTVTVSASNFDIRDLVYTADSVTAHQGGSWTVGVSGSVAVTGTFWQATQPVSASSLPLPTGASTEAKQPAFGTAGTPSADVVSVQGVAGGEPIEVTGTLTASGGLTDTQLRATSVPVSIAAPVTVVNLGTFGVQADTELPAATSQADATGNPTAPVVGAFLSGWNGSAWDRVKTVNTGQLKTTLYDTSGTAILPAPAALADAASNPTTIPVGSHSHLWNGSTWDREQGKESGTILASGTRNANTTTSAVTSRTAKGVIVYLNVTAYPGVGNTLNILLRSYDPVTNNLTTVYTSAASAISATGTYTFELCPGASTAHPTTGCGRSAQPLPYKWDVAVIHATGSGNWTYSVNYHLVP